MKSPIALLSSLFDDVKRLEPDVKGLDRDLISIEARFKHEGYGFLSIALSTLCSAVDLGLAEGRFACPTGFSRKGALPRIFSGLLCKVFDPKTGLLEENAPVGVVKCIREILRLFKKIQLSSNRVNSLHRQAVETFWTTDLELKGFPFPSRKLRKFQSVAKLMLPRLKNLTDDNLFGRHGPGAVAESVRSNQKWLLLARAIQEESFDAARFGLDLCMVDYHASTLCGVDSDQEQANELSAFTSRTAKLISVAKDCISRRTITVEPCISMFLQQGLNKILRDHIATCPILSLSLALTDQSENQILALEGSRTGEYATLDLSAASDRLSYKLVQSFFVTGQNFLRSVDYCRSSHVKDGMISTPLEKFAGMGNALTFPIQSAVFATLAIAAIMESEGKLPSLRNCQDVARRVRVYGDDIIVQTKHAHQVVAWLTAFGLKVNQKKSFMVGNFRESCGVDAFKGRVVTPLYIETEPCISHLDANALSNFVELSNHSWLRGLYKFSTHLQEIVEKSFKPLPLVSRESGALGWHTRIDSSNAQRWDKKLQRLVVRAPVVVAPSQRDNLNDYAALLKFYHTPLIERGTDHLSKSSVRYKPKIRNRWVPSNSIQSNPFKLIQNAGGAFERRSLLSY